MSNPRKPPPTAAELLGLLDWHPGQHQWPTLRSCVTDVCQRVKDLDLDQLFRDVRADFRGDAHWPGFSVGELEPEIQLALKNQWLSIVDDREFVCGTVSFAIAHTGKPWDVKGLVRFVARQAAWRALTGLTGALWLTKLEEYRGVQAQASKPGTKKGSSGSSRGTQPEEAGPEESVEFDAPPVR